jgi:excisionase family DNA binding protein
MFRVDPKTVSRWARSGRLHALRTLGGHRRYPESEIWALVDRQQD